MPEYIPPITYEDFTLYGDNDETPPRSVLYAQQPERWHGHNFETNEIERLRKENERLRGLLPDVETVEEAHEVFSEWAWAYASIGNIEKENEMQRMQLNTARDTWRYMWQVLVMENPSENPLPFERVRAMLWSLGQTLGGLE